MFECQEPGRVVRICRPAFQDFHRLLPRYYARSELNRQLQKLRWWKATDPFVVDLAWNPIPGTGLGELLIEPGFDFAIGLRVLFFEQPSDVAVPSIWVLGGLKMGEEFSDVHRMVYIGRSIIVKERVTE